MPLSDPPSSIGPTIGPDAGVNIGATEGLLEDNDPEKSILTTMVRATAPTLENVDPTHTTGDLRRLGFQPPPLDGECTPTADSNAANQDSYSIHALVATGGCGEVWMARQNSLGRIVALKAIRGSLQGKLPPRITDLSVYEQAFRLEARVTAQLEHPNIVPVYDFGADDQGMPVMAMKLVRGESWHEVLARDLDDLPLDDYLAKHLSILLSVMQAVAFAHSRFVVHRDLKPAQVMLGEFGEVVLMDWGLALSVAPDPSDPAMPPLIPKPRIDFIPTVTTAVNPCGTPCYMAPEQTQPTAAGISTRTDVYLLGGMLYQILTGCVPRRAPKARETIKLAAEGIIVPVDHAAPLRYHPPELVRITLRALDPQPNRRYPSVLIMQEEIRRYLSGASNRTEAETIVQTVRAGLDTLNTRLKARESVPVPQLYSICAQALSDLGRAEVLWPKINTVGPLRRQVLNTYAGTALEQGDLMLARGLSALMEQGEDRDLVTHGIARWEQDKAHQRIQRRLMAYALVALLILLIGGSAFYLEGQKQARLGLAVERDAADNARRAAARMQDTAEREQYFSSIAGADASIEKLRGDTAARLLLNSTKPELRTWEWGLLIRRVLGDQFSLKPLNFVLGSTWAPNNTHLYAGTRDGSLNIWDATTGRYQSIWKYFVGRLYEINPSPDNTRLLLTSFDHYALIVQARDGRIIHRLFGHQGILRGGAWEQTGRFVLTTSFDKTAALWNANSGQLVRRYIGFAKAVNGGAFGPGGSTVLLYSDDGTAALLDTLSGIRLITYSGPGPAIQDARFSQDYRRVITASQDGFLRIYDTESTQPLRAVRMPDSFPNTVCFVRGSRFVATVLENGDGSILDMETGEVLTRFLGEGLPRQIQTSPNGKVLTVAGRFAVRSYDLQRLLPDTDRMDPEHWDLARNHADVRLRVYGLTPGRDPTWEQLERAWNVPGGLTILRQEKRTVAVESRYSVFSPHGRWRFDLDPTTLQGAVIQTKPTTSVLYRTPSRVRIPYGQFSPDSQWLATLNPLDKVALIRTTDWRVAKTLSRQPANPSQPQSAGLESYTASEMAFSPDSRSIAVAYLNGRVAVFDVETGQLRYETPAIQGIGAGVTFDADGQWLITPSNDDRIYVWNAQTGQLDRTMIGHTRPVMGVALSPNKLRMASFARDRTVRLWDFPSGRELMTVVKTPDGKLPVGAGFTPDGLALIVIISDGTIQVHEAMPWREEDYPGGPQDPTLPPNIAPLTLAQRIELYNRRKLLGPHVTIDDLLHIPTYPTANYTSGTLPINP